MSHVITVNFGCIYISIVPKDKFLLHMGGVEKKNLLAKVVHMVQVKDAYVALLLAATLWRMPYTGEVRVAVMTAFTEPLPRTWAAEQRDARRLTGAVSEAQGEKTFSTPQGHLNTNFFKDFF